MNNSTSTSGVINTNTNNSLVFQNPLLLVVHSKKTLHSVFSIQLPIRYKLSFHLKLPSGSPLFASSTKGKTNTPIVSDDDDDEDVIVPLRNMRQWIRQKPLGFGEGKVYDTSMEDKLLQELEQSRVAQIANLNNNPIISNLPKLKVPQVVPPRVVRLINLPKKKNIHRDLQAAFKPFPGIINIIPAVAAGNQKTREPVCKGSAFVHFKSEDEANRFVDMFSTQPITFGKVQKQIRCEIMKPSLPNPVSVKPSAHIREKPLPVSNPMVAVNSSTSTETPLDPYVEDGAFEKFKNGNDDLVSATDEKNFGNFDNVVQEKNEPEAGSESSKKHKKVSVKGKKTVTGKKKAENTPPKLNIPGSANRLKMKEKALLSGVFSKYGGNSAKGTE